MDLRTHAALRQSVEQLDAMPNGQFTYADDQPLYSGAFMQSNRHHQHYFSNLDLFRQDESSYNYLKYAKAEEIAAVIGKQPHLMLRNIGFDLVSFDIH